MSDLTISPPRVRLSVFQGTLAVGAVDPLAVDLFWLNEYLDLRTSSANNHVTEIPRLFDFLNNIVLLKPRYVRHIDGLFFASNTTSNSYEIVNKKPNHVLELSGRAWLAGGKAAPRTSSRQHIQLFPVAQPASLHDPFKWLPWPGSSRVEREEGILLLNL